MEPAPAWWSALPRKRVGAGLLIRDGSGRILVVEPTYKDTWEIPGGLVEVGESPRAAARREALEELGLDVDLGRLLVVDYMAAGNRPGDCLMLVYEGRVPDDQRITLPADELRSWAWLTEGELSDHVSVPLLRRIRAAVQAARDGTIEELETM